MVIRTILAIVLSGATCGLLPGCQDQLTEPREWPVLDRPFFDCRVQPVVTKYCSAFACHGTATRYFYVFARNRLRLGGAEADRGAFLRQDERDFNYESALGFIDAEDPDQSLLLQKPLEQSAGGYFHVGATLYGGMDVFPDTDDPDYRVLADWIAGATEDPNCIEPGSDL